MTASWMILYAVKSSPGGGTDGSPVMFSRTSTPVAPTPLAGVPLDDRQIVAEVSDGALILAAVGLFTTQLGATWYEMALLIPDLLPWLSAIGTAMILTGITRSLIARHVWATAAETTTVNLTGAAMDHPHQLPSHAITLN